MATIFLRVVHWGKMVKISKHGWKLKLLPFSTELLFSFEIFSDHLFLMAKSKNTYMCHVIKIMASSASFKWSCKRKLCFSDIWSMFSKTFRYNTTKTGRYVKELPLSFPKVEKLLMVRFLLPFLVWPMVEKLHILFGQNCKYLSLYITLWVKI